MNNRDLRSDDVLDGLFDSARESYKNIRAPRHLRARVLAPRERRNLFSFSVMRPAAALASMALVVGCVLLALPRATSPSSPLGSPVTTHTVSYMSGLARASLPGENADLHPDGRLLPDPKKHNQKENGGNRRGTDPSDGKARPGQHRKARLRRAQPHRIRR